MSRLKKPRSKKYVARDINLDALSWALAGVHTLPMECVERVMAQVNDALTAFKRRTATREDWNMLVQCLNVAEGLAALHIGPNLLPDFLRAQMMLQRIALRMADTGSNACKAPELAAITQALAMYRIQLRLCSQGELSRALAKVKAMHNNGGMNEVAHLYTLMVDHAAPAESAPSPAPSITPLQEAEQ